jgi:protoporphyrinogen/coproporphyrinogen III oxidase
MARRASPASASSPERDVVVVGGGIAGLAAAHALRDRDVLLLEAEDSVGGRIRSELRDGYPLSVGAHLFPGPSSTVGRLISACGLQTLPVWGSVTGLSYGGRLLTSGRVETFPFRIEMSAAGRLSFLRAATKLRLGVLGYSRRARPRAGESALEVRHRLLEHGHDRSLAEYLGPLHPEADAIIRSVANRATAEPEEISAGAALALFAHVWAHGEEALLANLAGGAGALPRALASALGDRVRTGATVTEVEVGDKHVAVDYREGGRRRTARAKFAILAAPAFVSRAVLRGLPEPVDRALGAVEYGPYVAASILTSERGRQPWDDVYAVLAVGRSFTMLFNHAHVLRAPSGADRRPGGSFMVYAGAGSGRALLEAPERKVIDHFLGDLLDIYPGLKGKIKDVVVQRWPAGIPFARPGWKAVQSALDGPIAGRVYLAGDYLSEYTHMDVAAETGETAAAAIRARLGEVAEPR